MAECKVKTFLLNNNLIILPNLKPKTQTKTKSKTKKIGQENCHKLKITRQRLFRHLKWPSANNLESKKTNWELFENEMEI